ncbi:hypothetical protein [Halalkaliarchaeum desulfuricum]|nr:hypothetical protein [Halalkaliarchaeum desulfuricum]
MKGTYHITIETEIDPNRLDEWLDANVPEENLVDVDRVDTDTASSSGGER